MTRGSRRASSAPQRVGSDEGLTSSRPRVVDVTPGQDQLETAADLDDSEPSSDDAAVSGRHGRSPVDQTTDDTDAGWGERGDVDAAARWLRENRPPHWD